MAAMIDPSIELFSYQNNKTGECDIYRTRSDQLSLTKKIGAKACALKRRRTLAANEQSSPGAGDRLARRGQLRRVSPPVWLHY